MKSIDISNAIKVTGWMKPTELIQLGIWASGRQTILEVGSYHGRSTIAMLDNSDAHIWCVDSWNTGAVFGKDYDLFLANTERYSDRLTVLRGEGTDMLNQLQQEGMTFDMALIDDGHAYELARADIIGCLPLLVAGGLICGHDFNGAWPGVIRAVRELVPGYKVMKGTSLWWKVV
jgi:predicted O-methyltransferase YrrM